MTQPGTEQIPDFHLTEADEAAAKAAEDGTELEGSGTSALPDFHLTDADVKAAEHAQAALIEQAAPVADDHKLDELVKIAKKAGIDATGTKAEIAARLIDAGVLPPA